MNAAANIRDESLQRNNDLRSGADRQRHLIGPNHSGGQRGERGVRATARNRNAGLESKLQRRIGCQPPADIARSRHLR